MKNALLKIFRHPWFLVFLLAASYILLLTLLYLPHKPIPESRKKTD